MKKMTQILTALAVICFAVNCLAGVMPVILNCDFKVKGNILRVECPNLNYSKVFDTADTHEVNLVEDTRDGTLEISVHKEGSKYWEVSEMYEISLPRAQKLCEEIEVNSVYIVE